MEDVKDARKPPSCNLSRGSCILFFGVACLLLVIDWTVLRGSPGCVLNPDAHPVSAGCALESTPPRISVPHAATTGIVRAITGGIDAVISSNLPNMWDYYGNKTHPLPFPRLDMNARLRAKYFKMCAHMLHPNYTALVWADGAFKLQPGFVEWIIGYLADADAAFIRHPVRSSISEEMDFVYSNLAQDYVRARYNSEPMREQVTAYLQDGFVPKAAPLIAAGLFIRRNSDKVNRAFEHWYIENTKWTIQDQLSLPYIIWKHNLRVKYIPGSFLYQGPFHLHTGHVQLQ